MDIGLWKVCVDLTDANVFHSGSSDCRIGHCPIQRTFSIGANWDSHNLCEVRFFHFENNSNVQKSKASAAFDIFAFMATFMCLWYSAGYALRGRTAAIGWASVMGFLAGASLFLF